MSNDLIIILLFILGLLIVVQILSILFIIKMTRKITVLVEQLNKNNPKQIKSATEINSVKNNTCNNCFFRQTYFNHIKDGNLFLYKCKLHGNEIDLKYGCVNFHLESSTSAI